MHHTPAMRPASGPRAQHGFTLVELLVVVAIIALLLAVLLPSLRKARDRAKRAACAANLHELAHAWHMYLQDHADRFLTGLNANINYGGRQGIPLAEYGGNRAAPVPKPLNVYFKYEPVLYDGGEVFKCPADTGGNIAPKTFFEFYGTSYTANYMLVGGADVLVPSQFGACRNVMTRVDLRLPDLTRTRISNESRLMLVGDGGWANTWAPSNSKKVEWHRKAATHNVAFMDGHVEFLRIHKGLHVTTEYTVIPFWDLQDDACRCQR